MQNISQDHIGVMHILGYKFTPYKILIFKWGEKSEIKTVYSTKDFWIKECILSITDTEQSMISCGERANIVFIDKNIPSYLFKNCITYATIAPYLTLFF